MNRRAIVATHHKTGTVWMGSTFSAIAEALDLRYVKLNKNPAPTREELAPPVVLLHPHSRFENWPGLLESGETRVLHLIRDPRDVIVSAMHYHRHSREEWLHRPQERFGNKTYQQTLNGLPGEREQYLFEMENSSGHTIKAMSRWDYGQPNSMECKYEDLIRDEQMRLFTEICSHLGFSEQELRVCRRQFWRRSLFGKAAQKRGNSPHVRSGEPRQWPTVFDRSLAEAFIATFGDVLVSLGYETDNSWIDALPSEPAQPEAAD